MLQNEARKGRRLAELMEQLELESLDMAMVHFHSITNCIYLFFLLRICFASIFPPQGGGQPAGVTARGGARHPETRGVRGGELGG